MGCAQSVNARGIEVADTNMKRSSSEPRLVADTEAKMKALNIPRSASEPSDLQGMSGPPRIPKVVNEEAPSMVADHNQGFKTESKGDVSTPDYRMFFKGTNGDTISPWHDIPLRNADGTLNFVCEIPKETSAKFEVATNEPGNPIKQDIKKGNLRFYAYNINWNYGLLPQTWEDPDHVNPDCGGITGDNDPVDVVEIGSRTCETGGVYPVKALGVLAMIDDGELDWKVITIRVDDPLAPMLNDVADVERVLPGEIDRIRTWFRDYKTPDGKPQNAYGYDEECLGREFTLGVIEETHAFYKDLLSGVREHTPDTEDLVLGAHSRRASFPLPSAVVA